MEPTLNFEKTSFGYKVVLPLETVEAIKGMMIALSNGMINDYSPYLNDQLEDQLIARYVCSMFFSTKGLDLLEHGFNIVDVVFDKRIIKVSLGKVIVGDDKYELASGVIYKN